MKITVFLVGLLLVFTDLSAKVRILTFHYNKPEFIEMQHNTLKKFMQEEYELLVFNDAATEENRVGIEAVCAKYGIPCIRFQQEWHLTDPLSAYLKTGLDSGMTSTLYFDRPFTSLVPKDFAQLCNQPSIRHCHVIQYALDNFGYTHDDIVVILDGDAFPIRPFSVRSLLKDRDIAAIERKETHFDFLWVIFIAFNPKTLPDLHDFKCHVDFINGELRDSGSHTYYYLKDHPNLRVQKYHGKYSSEFYTWSYEQLNNYGFNYLEMWLIKSLPLNHNVEFHLDKKLIHFGGVSFNYGGHEIRTQVLDAFVKKLLAK